MSVPHNSATRCKCGRGDRDRAILSLGDQLLLREQEGKKTLEILRDVLKASQGLERLQQDLTDKIAIVSTMVS